MNLKLLDEAEFFAEYQNEPLPAEKDHQLVPPIINWCHPIISWCHPSYAKTLVSLDKIRGSRSREVVESW